MLQTPKTTRSPQIALELVISTALTPTQSTNTRILERLYRDELSRAALYFHLNRLKEQNIFTSRTGGGGGWILKQSPHDMTLASILYADEYNNPKTERAIQNIPAPRALLMHLLDQITISDLLQMAYSRTDIPQGLLREAAGEMAAWLANYNLDEKTGEEQ